MNAIRIAVKSFIVACATLLSLSHSGLSAAADITQQQLLQRLESKAAPLIVDVRRPDEFAGGHVPQAVNIPHTEIAQRLDELRPSLNNELVVYCESGRRAAIAQGILEQAGFTKVLHLKGDMKAWRKHGLPTEKPGSSPKS